MTSNSGTTVPMIKAAGRGVAETKAPPPPSLGTGDDVIGKGVSLLVVVESWVAMGTASGVGEQECITVVKSDNHRI